jgi:hypothetical protein
MTYTTDNQVRQVLEQFRRYAIDTQLALLWYSYLDIKDELSPSATVVDAPLPRDVYDQIADLAPDAQLQAQRDLLNNVENSIGKSYTALSPNARIYIWVLLGQGMETGEIIPMPSDYQLPADTQEFTDQIAQLRFEQRLEFMRSAVLGMGAQSVKAS